MKSEKDFVQDDSRDWRKLSFVSNQVLTCILSVVDDLEKEVANNLQE